MYCTMQSSRNSVISVKSWPHFSAVFKDSICSDDYIADDDDDDDNDNDQNARGFFKFFDFYDMEHVSLKEEENAIKRVVDSEAYCFDVVSFAEKFVDAVLTEARREVVEKMKSLPHTNPPVVRLESKTQNSSLGTFALGSAYDSYDDSAMVWPKISEFNIKLGQEKLEAYVSKWERSDDWLYCVEFLGFESEDCSNIFVYEVEWSKPTMSYPIPQVTASVFFAMEVYKMVPHHHDRNVEVSYVFECSNVIHKPGRIDFQEKWLQDIMDVKLKFFKSITFSVSILFYCSKLYQELLSCVITNEKVKKSQISTLH